MNKKVFKEDKKSEEERTMLDIYIPLNEQNFQMYQTFREIDF